MPGLKRVHGNMAGIDAVPVAGTPDEVAQGLRAVIPARAQMVLCNPVGATVAEDREQMERLAAEVLSELG